MEEDYTGRQIILKTIGPLKGNVYKIQRHYSEGTTELLDMWCVTTNMQANDSFQVSSFHNLLESGDVEWCKSMTPIKNIKKHSLI